MLVDAAERLERTAAGEHQRCLFGIILLRVERHRLGLFGQRSARERRRFVLLSFLELFVELQIGFLFFLGFQLFFDVLLRLVAAGCSFDVAAPRFGLILSEIVVLLRSIKSIPLNQHELNERIINELS